jgi:NifU-like protein involved in Fe-S cluster formation
MVEMVTGKRVEDARSIRHADVVAKVGPLPRHRQVCYGLAILALDDALNQIQKG